MALAPDQKFSTFASGGQLQTTDTIVGLRAGINTKFTLTNPLPLGYIVPIAQGGTAASDIATARSNLGLGSMALENSTSVSITGGSLSGVAITSSTASLSSGQVIAAPASGTDITNKTYVDAQVGGSVASVSGTLNIITSTGGVNPVINISASYVGQSSITTLGTIGTGVWQGTVIGGTYGGTGVNNGASTITLGGSLTTSGAFATTFTMTAGTNVTFPTSGTLATVAGTVSSITGTANQIAASASTGAVTLSIVSNPILPGTGGFTLPTGNTAARAGGAGTMRFNSQTTVFEATVDGSTWSTIETAATGVTSVSGTTNRITSTGGTTPVIDISASYVGQSSITTLGTIGTGVWNGTVIDLAHGGSNANLTASNGGIIYSTASAMAVLAGTATAGQHLQSGASAAPSWTTTTYPSTNAINTIMYASSANVLGSIAAANSSVLVTSAGGVPSFSTTLPSGLSATNITLTTPTLGAATATSLTFSPTTGGIVGTTTNNDTTSGNVGEFVSSVIAAASATALSNNIVKNVTSISLTAGDWDVWGNVGFSGGATTLVTYVSGWISSSSATFPDYSLVSALSYTASGSTVFNASDVVMTVLPVRLKLASTTTVYLSVDQGFSVSTCSGFGGIYARRRR